MSGPIFQARKSAKELIITGIYPPTVVATNEPLLVLTAVDVAGLPVDRTSEQLEKTHTESESSEATATTIADIDVNQTTVMQTVAIPKTGMGRTKYTRSEPVVGDLTSLEGRIETIQSWWVRYRNLS